MKRQCCVLIVCALVPLSTDATTILVKPDGTGMYPTIQAAVSVASPGDTVQLDNGIFTGAGNGLVDFQGKSIVVESLAGVPDSCTIAPSSYQLTPAFYFHSGETADAILQGIRIADCSGTAIRISSASPTLRNLILEDNDGEGSSGGMVISGATSAPLITHCAFLNNWAYYHGGGLMGSDNAHPTIEHCLFDHNMAGWPWEYPQSGDGGGIYCASGATVDIVNSTFINNLAVSTYYGSGLGGGVCGEGTIAGCTFYNNRAEYGAGAMWEGSVSNSIFAFNREGSGIYTSAVLACCDIFGNEGGDWVGGLQAQLGQQGNICADPLFCDAPTKDLTLHNDSPCAPEIHPECDLIGAWPVGCGHSLVILHPDGSGDFPTIQAALDALQNGDTAEMTDGAYAGPGNRDIDFHGKAITLRSQSGDARSCFIDCEGSAANPHRGFVFQSAESSATVVDGVGIIHGYAGGTIGNDGGAILCEAAPTISNGYFAENVAARGGAVRVRLSGEFSPSPTIGNCRMLGNVAGSDGGAISCYTEAPLTIAGCTMAGNRAANGGALAASLMSSLDLTNCTLSGNYASDTGGGIYCYGEFWVSVHVDRCIVRGNCAEGAWDDVYFNSYERGSMEIGQCSVVNRAGIGGPGSIWLNNVLETDPGLCRPKPCALAPTTAGEFTLHSESPCLPENNPCGVLVGARPEGCPLFMITGVSDILHDQGGRARVSWRREPHDAAGDTVVTFYALFRRVDPEEDGGGDGVRYPPGSWDFVTSVPAFGEEVYSTVCETLCDSTLSSGMCWSVFFVRAGTATPQIYFDTEPDSGYSADNLAPEPPEDLRFESPTVLAWHESTAEDFDYFTIYGGQQAPFDSSAVLIGCTSATTFALTGPGYPCYHVSATDFSGNEGPPATLCDYSAVEADLVLPKAFAVTVASSQPCRRPTVFTVALPSTGATDLRVFDATGRLVRTLVDGTLQAGRHSILWDGGDALGRGVPSGVYFLRGSSGSHAEIRVFLMLH